MKSILISVCSMLAAGAAWAVSCDVSGITWTQVDNGRVDITYELAGRGGYVAVDILLKGVSVTAKGTFTGAANTFVPVGMQQATWRITDADLAASRNPAGSFSVKVTASPIPLGCDYLAVELATGKATCYANAASVPGGVADGKWKTTHALFRRIPAAGRRTILGKLKGERTQNGTDVSSIEQHAPYTVEFEKDYYMAIYETTLGQYLSMGGTIPSGYRYVQNAFNGKKHHTTHQTDYLYHPIDLVSAANAKTVAATLTTRFAAAQGHSLTFALPNEDEWEFACRNDCPRDLFYGKYGVPFTYSGYDWNGYTVTIQGARKYYSGSTGDTTQCVRSDVDPIPVGQTTASAWGLYDMLGNVNEVVVTHDGTGYVTRGGHCIMSGESHIASHRDYAIETSTGDFRGFRLVCRP